MDMAAGWKWRVIWWHNVELTSLPIKLSIHIVRLDETCILSLRALWSVDSTRKALGWKSPSHPRNLNFSGHYFLCGEYEAHRWDRKNTLLTLLWRFKQSVTYSVYVSWFLTTAVCVVCCTIVRETWKVSSNTTETDNFATPFATWIKFDASHDMSWIIYCSKFGVDQLQRLNAWNKCFKNYHI